MKNSAVWNHFNIINATKSQCIHCEKIISKSGGTSNLIKHLARKHQDIAFELELINSRISIENHAFFKDDEKVRNFICMIKMNPILYTNSNFNDVSEYQKQTCETIWEEIANELEINANECGKIWTILRKQYEAYSKTKNPEKCKYPDELCFLEDYIEKKRIDKIPMRQEESFLNCYQLEDESKKVLISVPDISDTPIHEISVNKAEYINDDDDNSAENYEILFEEFDPILIKNQKAEEEFDEKSTDSKTNIERILPENEEWVDKTGYCSPDDGYNYRTQTELKIDSLSNYTTSPKNRKYSHRNEPSSNKTKLDNIHSSSKKMRKSLENMDEIDLFFEFIQRKLRKMPPNICRQLQMKFMETIQEAEARSRHRVDRCVDTSDAFQ